MHEGNADARFCLESVVREASDFASGRVAGHERLFEPVGPVDTDPRLRTVGLVVAPDWPVMIAIPSMTLSGGSGR